mmetsp:Transcript_14140/g.42679  ORF Transcript_14140/g.42679 Transcript_14140/m.42679 type:complete len:233 (+) Transcript_14140:976-1674(+)
MRLHEAGHWPGLRAGLAATVNVPERLPPPAGPSPGGPARPRPSAQLAAARAPSAARQPLPSAALLSGPAAPAASARLASAPRPSQRCAAAQPCGPAPPARHGAGAGPGASAQPPQAASARLPPAAAPAALPPASLCGQSPRLRRLPRRRDATAPPPPDDAAAMVKNAWVQVSAAATPAGQVPVEMAVEQACAMDARWVHPEHALQLPLGRVAADCDVESHTRCLQDLCCRSD